MTTLSIHRLAGRQLRQVNASLGPGLHVLLTLDTLGVDELVPLLDGSTLPRRGSVRLDGRQPQHDPELRRSIGSLWTHETLPEARSVRLSLEKLGFAPELRAAIESRMEEFRLSDLLGQPPSKLDVHAVRMVALAIALSKPDPKLLVLAEPLASTDGHGAALVIEHIGQLATTIPVLVTTASRMTATRLSGPSAELAAGFWRRVPPQPTNSFTLRVTGANLRTLAAEIVRRPRVQSLRLSAHAEGRDELWLATADPASVSLDVVRVTQQLGVNLWSIETMSGVG